MKLIPVNDIRKLGTGDEVRIRSPFVSRRVMRGVVANISDTSCTVALAKPDPRDGSMFWSGSALVVSKGYISIVDPKK